MANFYVPENSLTDEYYTLFTANNWLVVTIDVHNTEE